MSEEFKSNFSILYDYYIDGSDFWLVSEIDDLKNDREPLKKLLTALANNTYVKYLEIRLSMLTYDEVVLFANSLEKNTSLTTLYVTYFTSYDEDQEDPAPRKAFERLFIALSSRTTSLEGLFFYGSRMGLEPTAEKLLEAIRNNPKLKRFDLNMQLGDIGVIRLIKQIGESCPSMKYLTIDSDVGPDVAFALAEMVGKSRTLKYVSFCTNQEFDFTEEETDRVEKLIGTEIKTLTYLEMRVLTRDLKIVDENKKNAPDKHSHKISSNYKYQVAYEEWMKNLHSQEANYDVTKLPVDLMFAILVFTNDLTTIQSFFKTNKYWRSAAKKHHFWQHMVNSFVPAVDPDVLAHTDVVYAKHLEDFGANRANFWELLLQHSYHHKSTPSQDYFEIHNIDKFAQRLPFHHPMPSANIHDQLLTAIFRRWPNITTHVQLIKMNSKRHPYLTLEKPYCWMHLAFGFSNLYHIIIQTYGNKRITGFFFISSNGQSFFNEPLEYMEQAMDHFVAESVDEALVKMKRMLDTWAGALGRKYELSSPRPLLRSILEKARDHHQILRKEISDEIEEIVADIIAKYDVTATDAGKIVDQIEKTTKRLREQPILFYNEFVDRKYKLPDRYSLHLQYPKEILQNVSFFKHNRSGDWGKQNNGTSREAIQKKKDKKPSIKGTLSKLIRIIMNFVLMPVLKTLWPRHRSEVDRNEGVASKTEDKTIMAYYFSCYQPLSNVSITDSYPMCWPISALVMAKQILVKLGQLIEYLVSTTLKRKYQIEYNIDTLLEDLSHYDLIPQKHLNGLKIIVNDLVREI